MKFSKLFLIALASSALSVSCSNDDVASTNSASFNNGVFILNEGGQGQSTVSYVSNDFANFTQDVYASANGSDLMGQYAQSMFFNGDYAYIIAGGSNKINVVNRHTFKLVAKIESGLKNPRYGVARDGMAYVTNANTYADYGAPATAIGNTDDYVAVINLSTNVVESNIALNATANRIVLENDKLYITEPFSNDKVLVVNAATKTLETPITVGSDADYMEAKDGILYVMRSPWSGAGEIVKVNLSDSSLSAVSFPSSLSGVKNLDIEGNKIYYTAGTSVYAMDINADAASANEIFSYLSNSEFGAMYGFAVHNDRIYIADGGDFTASSKAFVYSLTGTLQKEVKVGVGPNGFYFNN